MAREACARLPTCFRTDLLELLWQNNEAACSAVALVQGIQVLCRRWLHRTESVSKNYNRRYKNPAILNKWLFLVL